MRKQSALTRPRFVRTAQRFEPAPPPGVGTLLMLHPDLDAWAMRAAKASGFGGDAMPGATLRVPHRAAASAPIHAPRPSRPLRRLRALLRLFGRRARHRAGLRELELLDAATLRDLGLHRGEVGSVLAERIGLAMTSRRRFDGH